MCLGSKQQMSPEDTPQLCASSRRGAHWEDKASSWGGILSEPGLLSALGSRLCSPLRLVFAKSWSSPCSPACIYQNFCFFTLLSWGSPEDTNHLSYCLPNINNSLCPSYTLLLLQISLLISHPQASFVLFTIRRRD